MKQIFFFDYLPVKCVKNNIERYIEIQSVTLFVDLYTI